jgi:hypothetical protein
MYYFFSFSSLLEETEAVFEVIYSITYSTMAMFVEQLCNRQKLVDIPVLNLLKLYDPHDSESCRR